MAFGVHGPSFGSFDAEFVASGAKWGRVGVDWRSMETSPGVYDWTPLDTMLASAAAAGVYLTGTLIHTPEFYQIVESPMCSMISGLCAIQSQYYPNLREFCRQVAIRCSGSKMLALEAGNEVTDLGTVEGEGYFEGPLEDYNIWIKEIYSGVKSGDPNMLVTLAGTVFPSDVADFTDYAVKTLSLYYDIYNVHLYYGERSVDWGIDYIQRKMSHYGIHRPIWVTETSTIVTDSLAALTASASDVVKRHVRAVSHGAEHVIWYTFVEVGMSADGYGSEAYRSLKGWGAWGWTENKHDPAFPDPTFHPRPAYTAAQVMNSKIGNYSSIEAIDNTWYKATVGSTPIWIAWGDGLRVPPECQSYRLRITDYLGNVSDHDGFSYVLTDSPVYIERLSGYKSAARRYYELTGRFDPITPEEEEAVIRRKKVGSLRK